LDVEKREDFSRHWKSGTRSIFLAEHVFEHLSEGVRKKAVRNCFEFLKSGGRLRIAVPDGYHPDPDYIEWVRPSGKGDGAKDHQILFNYKLLKSELEDAGFEVVLLEYWDEVGQFHQSKWSDKDGPIARSLDNDTRNQSKPRAYTSLIVDAVKP
jgi:predicted SAM-dependent methyltransferase